MSEDTRSTRSIQQTRWALVTNIVNMRTATSQLSSLFFFSSVYYRIFRIGQGNAGRIVCLREKNTIENGFRRINRIFILLFKFSTESHRN